MDTSEGLPSGTVTFVLADIVGSTALWERSPEATAEAVAALEGMVDKLVVAWRGARPVEQGEGDSFVAAFAHAVDAVRFAVELQSAIARETWPEGLVLSLRVGVHTGDARLEDGLYRGETLNRCARIRALAHGGQVLLSGATAELVVDRLEGGVFLKDLGQHRLRDLARPEHIRQLCRLDLPVEFPALLSLDRMPNNLPLQLTSFIGRDADVAHVTELLEGARLVTLTGAGGSGKTRLAVQAAGELLDRYVDGSWLVDLAATSEPELVVRSVAAACGVRELPLEEVHVALERYLAERHVLLIVDNCEHLIDASASVVSTLLSSCRSVSVLATSREPLGVSGEIIYRVPSLALPTGDDVRCASVELFTARATAARPAFRLTDDNADAVASICSRVDGLPLAIELAAARCRALSPTQIEVQLADRFSLLAGGARSAVARQRTLEASVGWSVDLLTDAERALLRRLSVFSGSFSLDAAESVGTLGADDGWQVVDLLTSLVDKSLVHLDEDGEEVRYRLLETIRHFAAQQLLASNETVIARDAHAQHYLTFVETTAPGLVGPNIVSCFAALARELENIRSAQEWLVRNQQVDAALRLAAELQFLWTCLSSVDVRQRLTQTLALDGGDTATRIRVQFCASEVAWLLGDIENDATPLDDVEQYARMHDDVELVARVELLRGWKGILLDDPDAETHLVRARDGLQQIGDHFWAADASIGLALAFSMRGDYIGADRIFRDATASAHKSRNPVELGRALLLHSNVVMLRGDSDTAERMLDEADGLRVGLADRALAPMSECFRALLAALRGRFDEAIDRTHRAAAEAERGGFVGSLAWSLWVRLVAQRWAGRGLDPELIDEVEGVMGAFGLGWGVAWAHATRAECALAAGDLATARRVADDALAIGEQRPFAGYARSHCLLVCAAVRHAADDPSAEEFAQHALATSMAADLRWETIEALELLAELAADGGDPTYAARLLGAAQEARQHAGFATPTRNLPSLERLAAALAEALGAERLDADNAAGASLTLTDAVAYATRGRGPRKRPASGWQSLTPTEHDVVELAAQGLPNADIAKQLFVSVPTIKTHLAHIFTKLGVSTRAQLAAQAARREPQSTERPQ
ncbi:MAG: LuxR C-terminal-related transcriptional regulator [Actinomycetota bacterium]|nr:LuxR C-terminal-related transcriptional regulator [Actinomycetota bacterium]